MNMSCGLRLTHNTFGSSWSLRRMIEPASFGVAAIGVNIAWRAARAQGCGNRSACFRVDGWHKLANERAMQKFDANKDYYAELGLSQDANKEEIDRAFRSQARKHHPDGGGSEEAMKSLNEAHDVLSDPDTRKAYDDARAPARIAYGSSAAFDPEAASRAGTLKIPVK